MERQWEILYDRVGGRRLLNKVLYNDYTHNQAQCSGNTIELSWGILEDLAHRHGASFYLLNSWKFEQNYNQFLEAFRHIYPKTFIGYSYKTNYTPKLCSIVNRKHGYAEVVSDMELDLAIKVGVPLERIIYNGPFKDAQSIKKCLLGGGIVNLDSQYEVPIVEKLARENPQVNMYLGIRCNFDIGDSLISRFGFDIEGQEFSSVLEKLQSIPNIRLGLHCHFPNRCLESFVVRVEKMLQLSAQLFSSPPEFIDIGGGFFGEMGESLRKQFKCKVPSYQEYAEAIATRFQSFYGAVDEAEKPNLFIEPGTALVADTMKFVTKVISVKRVRNKTIATVSGSKFNILPASGTLNLPINVFHKPNRDNSMDARNSIDIAGYTCIENDYLYRQYQGSLSVGDYIVFDNVGSYSIVLKPPFILPNSAVVEYNSKSKAFEVVKRKEETDDIFRTFVFGDGGV